MSGGGQAAAAGLVASWGLCARWRQEPALEARFGAAAPLGTPAQVD